MFSEPAREAIARAQAEAREMGHDSVQVEHLLLGLFADQAGISGRVFADFGLTVDRARGQVRAWLGAALSSLPEGRLPFSPEAKEALRLANRIGMGAPGIEHMLIVMVRRGDGGACEILRALGADPHRIRFETKSGPGRLASQSRAGDQLAKCGTLVLCRSRVSSTSISGTEQTQACPASRW